MVLIHLILCFISFMENVYLQTSLEESFSNSYVMVEKTIHV